MSNKNPRATIYFILCIGYMGFWVWEAIIRIGTFPEGITPYDAFIVPSVLLAFGIPMFLGYMLGSAKNENS
jgi:hypothetical protein